MKPKQISSNPKRLDPLEWIGQAKAQPDLLRAIERQLGQRRRRRMGALAGSASVLLLSVLFWQAPWRSEPHAAASTAVVRLPETATLPDGSVIELRPGAKYRLEYSDSVRRIELTSGEAHFQVAKNRARPFVVAVGAVEIRAVGTAFSVDRTQTEVAVLVTEGRVAVDRVIDPLPGDQTIVPTTLTTLTPGDRTVLSLAEPAASPVQSLATAELSDRLSWRVPRLEFSGTPLDQAIPLFNEHSRIKVILADPSLGAVRLSGVIRADNVETLRELLFEAHGIEAAFRSDTELVLSRSR